tara:strand:- start:3623 stop:3868 length:246 start_codon:yes stop_codon:yes gene_type:complete
MLFQSRVKRAIRKLLKTKEKKMDNSNQEKKYQDSSVMRYDSLFISKSLEYVIVKVGSNSLLIQTQKILDLLEAKKKEPKSA